LSLFSAMNRLRNLGPRGVGTLTTYRSRKSTWGCCQRMLTSLAQLPWERNSISVGGA
jgi:hypothetical protein